MRARFILLGVALLAGVAVAGPAPAALAATFTANSTADDPDRDLNDGFCVTTTGACTLRAAIQQANALGTGPHSIGLIGGATYTLTRTGLPVCENAGATGDLDVATNLTIIAVGGPAVVRGADGFADRVFEIHSGVRVELNGLEIQNGNFPQDLSCGNGGGIRNRGTLTITNSTVSRNRSGIFSDHGTLIITDTTVSGNDFSGISNDGGSLTIRDSTVTGNGSGISNLDGTLTMTNSTVSANGAAVNGEGGIVNSGAATLTNTTISGNSADRSGGGIANSRLGTLTIMHSTVNGNTATTPVGAPPRSGGGILNAGTLTMTDSTVGGNRATDAGGIYNFGTLRMTNTTVSGNNATHDGGGIYNVQGVLIVESSTVSGNNATDGAGIYNLTQPSTTSPPTTLTLTNSTISTNRALGNGGGIWNSGTVTANNVTIASNIADNDADGTGDGGGIFNIGTVTVANTIIGTNLDQGATKVPDCGTLLTSQGYNLIKDMTGCIVRGDTTGNIIGRDPQLGPLQNNGGPTFTHALLILTSKLGGFTFPSPAIDAGSPGTGTSCASTDQHGVDRPVDGNADSISRCDIGAYEYVPPFLRPPLGTWALTSAEAAVRPGERLTYTLMWTVPPPRGWRSLRTLELAFLDDDGIALWVRFDEVTGAPGLFRLVNPKNGNAGPAFAPGRQNRLESEFATLYLAETAVDGPPGSKVTLTLTLRFKPHAAGRSYDVLVGATDDGGEVQGFHRAGAVTVSG